MRRMPTCDTDLRYRLAMSYDVVKRPPAMLSCDRAGNRPTPPEAMAAKRSRTFRADQRQNLA